MNPKHAVAAITVTLAVAVLTPAESHAQEWCSKAASKLCGVGTNPYPVQFTGTIHMNSSMTAPEYWRRANYVITLRGDGTAECQGTLQASDLNETLNHEGHVTIHMDAWSSGRRTGGEYSLGAFCAEDLLWHEEYVAVDARSTSYSSLSGQLTQEHPSTDRDNGVAGVQSIRWQLTAPPPRR